MLTTAILAVGKRFVGHTCMRRNEPNDHEKVGSRPSAPGHARTHVRW
jgi:hypothetical protein